MRNISRPAVMVIIAALIVVGFTVYSFLAVPSDPKQDNAQQNQETDTAEPVPVPDLSEVNPEEDNLLLKTAGLPYEDNRFAITYREKQGAYFNVVIRVIDKTQSDGASQAIRKEANKYLRTRGVDLSAIDIEYGGLNSVR